MKKMLKRKIDQYLVNWKNNPHHMPLIVRGARQIGKTKSIEKFAQENYESFIEINFALQKQYMDIFANGFDVDMIVKNISYKNTEARFIPHKTLIFFDEIQINPNAVTSLKSFCLDGRYDVICSGSLMGINYQEIESNAVGHKIDYEMKSMDFEEFLGAKGYKEEQIKDIFSYVKDIKPLPSSIYSSLEECFKEYIIIGGMPAIVRTFIEQNHFAGILEMQRQIIRDYEEDITKYAGGLDKTRILSVFHKIPVFLGNENKKFMISKIESGRKSRDYVGVIDWLVNSGIVNISYCLEGPSLPLKGHYNPNSFRLYFMDTGLLVGSLDKEKQIDLREGNNLNIMKGAIYENIVADMLVKAGYDLFFYKDEKGRLEMDFFIRSKNNLIPIEVKATDGATISLNKLIENAQYQDIRYGIKLAHKNIGFNGKFYTFPYFLTFMIEEFIKTLD